MRTHGRPATYTAGGCRCDDCRQAATAWLRARRNRGKTLTVRCVICDVMFASEHGRNIHEARVHT